MRLTDDNTILAGLALLEQAEAQALREDFGSMIDPNEYLYDDGDSWLPMYAGGYAHERDRRDGADWQVFRTETELTQRRALARYLCAWNETASGLIDKYANYVIGDGIQVRTELRQQGGDEALATAVSAFLELFFEANRWRQHREREFFVRRHRDGEYFAALWPTRDGVAIRAIEPGLVRKPPGGVGGDCVSDAVARGSLPNDCALSCEFGVVTRADDVETVFGYTVEWEPGIWQFMPESRVVHAKGNVDGNVVRGVTDFWPVFSRLNRTSRLMNITTSGAMAQAAIAFVVEHPQGATASGVQSLLDGKRDALRTTRTGDGDLRSDRYQVPQTSKRVDIPAGKKYVEGPQAERAAHFLSVVNQGLRLVGSRWSMPEYLITSDASNSNFASTLVAGDPWVKACEHQQRWHGGHNIELAWKAIALACASGVIDLSVEELRAAVVLRSEGPPVAVRDRESETRVNQVLNASGLLSGKTWAAREGIDYEQELKQGAARQQPQFTGGPSTVYGEPSAATPTAGDSSIAFNGAQIQAATQIVAAVAAGEIPRDSALSQLSLLFNISASQAAQMLGSAGAGAGAALRPSANVAESLNEADQAARAKVRELWAGYGGGECC